jgi:putative protease
MSGMIGGRSGNRGRCAQPCRLPYQLVDEKGGNVLEGKDVGQYLLSPRDFCTIDKLPEVVKAGARSLKIEGRMKRPEYVAVVVDAYRQSLDSIRDDIRYTVDETLKKDLTQIFNRDFTTAYLEKKPGKTMMSDRRPNNRGVRVGRVVAYDAKKKLVTMRLDERMQVGDIIDIWVKVGGRVNTTIQTMTMNGKEVVSADKGAEVTFAVPSHVRVSDRAFKVYDAALMERAKTFYAGGAPVRRVGVAAEVFVSEGQPLTLTLRDADGNIGVGQTDFLAEAARKRPLSAETVQKQLERLGTTMFALDSLDFDCEGELMVPVSELNEVRRRAVAQLEEARLAPYMRESAPYRTLPKLSRNDKETKPLLSVHTDTIEKVETAYKNGADVVLFGGENFAHKAITHSDYEEAVRLAKTYGKKIIFATPRIAKQWQMKAIEEELRLFNKLGGDGVSVGNLGVMALAQEISELPIHADFSLNIYNAYAVDYLKEQGISSVTLSPELNFGQVERLVRRATLPTECIVHGHLPLMVSEYCVLGSFLGDIDKKPCSQVCTKQKYYLQDRMSERFPIATDQFCRMHILNTKELSMLPHVERFGEIGVSRIRIEGKYMAPKELADLVRRYRLLLDAGNSLTERELTQWAHEKENITRGHYFRGVL